MHKRADWLHATLKRQDTVLQARAPMHAAATERQKEAMPSGVLPATRHPAILH